jgi:GNAT superfamily N-acetyltransferase
MRSKAHWGYDEDFMQRCREELQILGAECDGTRVKLAETGNRLVGFYKISGTGGAGRLDALFVDPHYIGHGAGKLLLSDARTTARGLGMSSLTLDSDPHAASFYDRMGAIRTGEAASGSIEGRVLPQYRFELAD